MVSKGKPLGNKKRNNKRRFTDTVVKVNQPENVTKNVNIDNLVVTVAEKEIPRTLRGSVAQISRSRINPARKTVSAVVTTQQEVLHKMSRRTIRQLFSKDQQFRKIIYADEYCYVGGRYILRTPKAFTVVEGKLTPNTSLPNFERDYCLGIERTILKIKDTPKKVVVSVACKHAAKHDEITKEEQREFDQLMYLYLGIKDGDGGDNGNEEESFGEVFTKLMKREKVSDLDMWERTGFSERQIRRFRNNEQEPKTLEDVIVLCIALGLTASIADLLINAAGRRLRRNRKEMTYKFLLETFSPRRDVVAANKFLIKRGMDPLTNKMK